MKLPSEIKDELFDVPYFMELGKPVFEIADFKCDFVPSTRNVIKSINGLRTQGDGSFVPHSGGILRNRAQSNFSSKMFCRLIPRIITRQTSAPLSCLGFLAIFVLCDTMIRFATQKNRPHCVQ
jgi:hypothetical protein